MTDHQPVQIVQNLVATLHQLGESLQTFIRISARISETITPYVESLAPYIEQFARYNRFIDSVHATGWLPYHTVAIDYVEECNGDVSLLETRLTDFYKDNWESIHADIDTRLDQYQVSEETKATFREALDAHGVGHYRCVCRVLFPQVDREFRIHFFEDKAGPISSKDMLERLTKRRELVNFLPREAYGWILFGRLVDHLYAQVDDTNREQYEQDYVPNRHASIHGLVPYAAFKHSVNMIVMADYIFQVLTSTAALASPEQ